MNEPLGAVVAFSAGLFSFLSPCVLPLFPSYLPSPGRSGSHYARHGR
jgi:cytochrome c biogenesis protein CcdA